MVYGIGSANPSDQKIVEVGTISVRCEGLHKKDQSVPREGVGKESNRYGASAVHAAVRQSIPARLFLKLAKNVEIFGGKYLKGTVTNMAGDPKTNTEF